MNQESSNQKSFIFHFSLFILHSLFPLPPFIGAVVAAINHFTTSPFVRQQASVVRALFLRQSFFRLDGLHFVPTVLGSLTPYPQSYALSYFCQLPLTHTGSGSSCHVHKPAQFHSGSHLAGRHPTRHFLIKPSYQPNPIGVLLTILPAMNPSLIMVMALASTTCLSQPFFHSNK